MLCLFTHITYAYWHRVFNDQKGKIFVIIEEEKLRFSAVLLDHISSKTTKQRKFIKEVRLDAWRQVLSYY